MNDSENINGLLDVDGIDQHIVDTVSIGHPIEPGNLLTNLPSIN